MSYLTLDPQEALTPDRLKESLMECRTQRCNGHGDCVTVNGLPACECMLGYIGDACEHTVNSGLSAPLTLGVLAVLFGLIVLAFLLAYIRRKIKARTSTLQTSHSKSGSPGLETRRASHHSSLHDSLSVWKEMSRSFQSLYQEGETAKVRFVLQRRTSDSESTITVDTEENTEESRNPAMTEHDCPLCQESFPLDLLQVHASTCDERPMAKADSLDVAQKRGQSLEDILQNIADQVDKSRKFSICVTRSYLLLHGLQEWQRQNESSPKCSLHVSYVGEAGIDRGALKKDFLTDMISGIETRFFEPSTDQKGKNPIYSITALDQCYFRTFGEIFAVSLAQGGPSPNFMRDWCYTYLATGDFDRLVFNSEDVTDQETRELISKVTRATAEELPNLTDDILSCGYTGVISLGNKDQILRTIVLHSVARLLPMLQQLRKGLQLYNLQKAMELNTELCRPLFVPLEDNKCLHFPLKPDALFIMANCKPHLSEKGTIRYTLEMDILNNFQHFLQEVEDNGVDSATPEQCYLISGNEALDTEEEPSTRGLTVPGILHWLTGQAHKPILPSEKSSFKIHIKFNHDCHTNPHEICFPAVSVCCNILTFPTAHMKSYKEFKSVMALALRFDNTFSKA